jgi:hypothetical protein
MSPKPITLSRHDATQNSKVHFRCEGQPPSDKPKVEQTKEFGEDIHTGVRTTFRRGEKPRCSPRVGGGRKRVNGFRDSANPDLSLTGYYALRANCYTLGLEYLVIRLGIRGTRGSARLAKRGGRREGFTMSKNAT